MHLEFIVDQTAKYSNWLVKGLTTISPSATPSELSLRSASAVVDGVLHFQFTLVALKLMTLYVLTFRVSYYLTDSDAFLTPEEISDDEETIEKEELQMEQEVSCYPQYACVRVTVCMQVCDTYYDTSCYLIRL